jgi:hypothetical protein
VKRPKGPELKMPGLKAPTLLADLYYDLRDRRLLPLIALVLVAIVATPFLLSQGSEAEEAIPVPAAIQALKEGGAHRTSSLTVVEANPGLRDYRKRLRGRTPLDPFRTFGKPSLKGAQLGGESEGEGGGSSGSSTPTTSTSTTVKTQQTSTTKTTNTTSPGGANGSQPGGTNGSHVVFFAWAIDAKIVKTVDGKQQDPIVKEHVLSETPLPGEKTPVVTYMGPAREGKKPTGKALLLVSNEVRSVAGDAKCLSGDETCQLLEVEPGFPEVFTYGENEDKYTITVLKLGLVATGHS